MVPRGILSLPAMKILILGSGGREHALADKIASGPLCSKLYVAPGNAGTSLIAANVNINPNDFEAVKKLVVSESIEMVVVGPEAPLVAGIVDFFAKDDVLRNVAIIGPSAKGAMLEGSKDFAKEFMTRHQIPTARFKSFKNEELNEALTYLETHTMPVVLKADGLAAGKGVVICETIDEAKKELNEMFSGKFGQAGATVVIEQFLKGIEFSVFVLTDGKNYVVLPEAKDYKRIGEGDTGLNTGGMGAVSPVPFVDDTLWEKVRRQIIEPSINGIREENLNYKGFLFIGLINVDDEPYVIEYNCRMGDPETEVVMPRLRTDLIRLLQSTWDGTLDEMDVDIDDRYAVTIVLASGGYPGHYEKGKVIHGLDHVDGSRVYHAGTVLENGEVLTAGGRVIAITSMASNLPRARDKSLINANAIEFEGKYFRHDIGRDLVHTHPEVTAEEL